MLGDRGRLHGWRWSMLPMALGLLAALGPTAPALAAIVPGPRHDTAVVRTGVLAGTGSIRVERPGPPAPCPEVRFAVPIAKDILAGRLQLGPHPAVRLPRDPSWRENPVHDVNWPVRYQGLSWLGALIAAWEETHDGRYARRVRSLVDDWLADNPPGHGRSGFSWYDQATGVRAGMLACVAAVLGSWPRLRAGLLTHGRVLADPGFYVWQGNHALDQSIGLLDVGRATGVRAWMDLARDRIGDLVVRSVSANGVTNEQAVGYQAYNLRHYSRAAARLMAYGMALPAGMWRVERMPWFLAFAILPDGTYDQVGDTEAGPVGDLSGTIAERSASAGRSGRLPGAIVASFPHEGWLFARTGWGLERPFRDERAMSVHFGRPPAFHGHADGGSVTLYGFGSRLVLDPGKLAYTPSRLRTWFRSRRAHNVVLLDGVRLKRATTSLVRQATTPRMVSLTLRTSAAGTSITRTVLFSRRLGYVVVQDLVLGSTTRTARQRWHLREGSRPLVRDDGVVTRRARGNVLVLDLAGSRARIAPGWVSYHYGSKVAAPVVELVRRGRAVRFLTVLVPGAGMPDATVTGRRLTADGFSFTITVDGVAEHVAAGPDRMSITDAGT